MHLFIYNNGFGNSPILQCSPYDFSPPCTITDCPLDPGLGCQHTIAGTDTCWWPDTNCFWCDSHYNGCDYDTCDPVDACEAIDRCYYKDTCTVKDYSPCVKRDCCHIDFGKCDGVDVCDFDNECGTEDVDNQPIFP